MHVRLTNLRAASDVGIYLDTARKQAKPFSCWGYIDLICLLEGEIYRCGPSPPESDIGSPQEGRIQLERGVKNRVQTKWQRGPLCEHAAC